MKSILENLNVAQREAVLYKNKPLLIIAGPGSGKTRVITHRIAYLIRQQNIQPHRIFAATFTKKAASEMKKRLENLIGDRSCESLWAGTFHSLGFRILREDFNLERLDYSDPVSVYDTYDGKTIIRRILDELGYDLKTSDREQKKKLNRKVSNLQRDISRYKTAGDVPSSGELRKVFLRYQQMLKNDNAIDFDDMLVLPVRLFQKFPKILEQYQEKFLHAFVDEYQDTNMIQNELIRLLSGKYYAITVVGDDDQSIYKFRGANIANILQFEQEYDAHIVRLEQNYRSTRNIVDAASQMIQNNPVRLEKELWTENDAGKTLICCEVYNQFDEAEWIGNKIQELQTQGVSYSDCAIFYRINQQANQFDKTFSHLNIPFEVIGRIGFFERKEIKDVLAYLKLVCNKTDNLSLERIIHNTSCGIGAVTLTHIRHFAETLQVSLFEAILKFDKSRFPSALKNRVRRFLEIFKGLDASNKAIEALNAILERTEYLKKLQDSNSVQAETRGRNVLELIERVQEYQSDNPKTSVADFLIDSALITIGGTEENDTTPKVSLMTLHKSKGLEFPYVFIPGCEQSFIPYDAELDEAGEYDAGYREAESGSLDEERRLFYVGITRAMKQVFLVHANERFIYGSVKHRKKSPFINEIPATLLNFIKSNKKTLVNSIEETHRFPSSQSKRTADESEKNYQNLSDVRRIVERKVFTFPSRLVATVDLRRWAPDTREVILEAIEFLNIRDYERTIELLQEMAAMNRGFNRAYYTNLALGCDSLKQEELDNAIMFFQEAISANPECSEAHYILSIACLKMSQFRDSQLPFLYLDQAKKSLLEAVMINDLSRIPRFFMEVITELSYQLLQAINDQEISLHENIVPYFEDPESHYNLAIAYFNRDNFQLAVSEISEALSIDTEYEPALELAEIIKENYRF